MTIVEQLQKIGCVSTYEERAIDEADLTRIVEAASWAPSAGNAQPWEIIAVRDHNQKAALIGTLLDSLLRPDVGGQERRDWILQAPVVLVVCLDQMRAKVRFGEVGELVFGIQDAGAAIQNMRLVALECGVQSCLIREFDPEQLVTILNLPRHVRPLTLIAMGYSQMISKPRHRLVLDDYLHFDEW